MEPKATMVILDIAAEIREEVGKVNAEIARAKANSADWTSYALVVKELLQQTQVQMSVTLRMLDTVRKMSKQAADDRQAMKATSA